MNREAFSRRDVLKISGAAAGASLLSGCEKKDDATPRGSDVAEKADYSNDEYVWLSAHANLPLYVAHDHVALRQVGKELGVKVTIAGPDTVNIPALVAAVEQTAARRPAGMMVSGWDPSALIAPINSAVERGIPVVCVDTDVFKSRRLAFVGTDWYELGATQARAMVEALNGKKGKVALMGLIEHWCDQQGFAGFRSVTEKAGLEVMEPQQDRGNIAEAARVASAIIQATPDIVGIAGFDSESGPGIGLAIKEAGKAGKIVATTVDAEEQHVRLVKEGVLTAAVGQKRELFTYYGVKVLFEVRHSRLKFTADDKKAGVVPIPNILYTGSYTVTKANVDLFLKA